MENEQGSKDKRVSMVHPQGRARQSSPSAAGRSEGCRGSYLQINPREFLSNLLGELRHVKREEICRRDHSCIPSVEPESYGGGDGDVDGYIVRTAGHQSGQLRCQRDVGLARVGRRKHYTSPAADIKVRTGQW